MSGLDYTNASMQLDEFIRTGTASVSNLFSLVGATSATVVAPGDTLLLQSGTVNGTRGVVLANQIVESNANVRTIADTPVARLLDSNKFNNALLNAVAREDFPGVTDYASASPSQQASIAEKALLYTNGYDSGNNRVNSTSLWDIASHGYVTENDGKWRILIGENIDPNSVLVKTEIPALLSKGGDFTIDGVAKSTISASGSLAEQASHVLAQASLQTTASNISLSNVDNFVTMTPQNALSVLTEPSNAALRATALRALDKLGWAGDLLALGLVATEANAAYAAGDATRGNALLGEWAGGFAGGLAGGLVAAKIVGSALAPLYLTGPAGSLIAGGLTLLAGLVGGVVGGYLGEQGLRSLMSMLTSSWTAVKYVVSPLILDLDGDGVETQGQGNSTYFDHEGDGFAERTGWVGRDDGLLVRDLNDDGKISSGAELFGNHTILGNGQRASNGFSALAELDSNGDGKISSSDAAWNSLQVWRDYDGDGITDTNELLTLAQAGVGEIGLGYTNRGDNVSADANGNQHRQIGRYTTTGGTSLGMNDVWFGTTHWNTRDQRPSLAISASIQALPDILGPGTLGSLHQAMARDASGALQAVVTAYANTSDAAQQAALLNEILYRWAGVYDQSPGSRGSYMDDGRKLAFLEAAFGENFVQVGVGPDPGGYESANMLIRIFATLSASFAVQLDMLGPYKPLLDAVILVWDEDSQGFVMDVSEVEVLLRRGYAQNAADASNYLAGFAQHVGRLGSEELVQALNAAGSHLGDAVDRALFWLGFTWGTEAAETIYGVTGFINRINGLGGNDTIVGAQLDDELYGGAGNDTLIGYGGNDLLVGGLGNDTLRGESGNDTYLFNLGDGNDIIDEGAEQGTDTLRLGEGITTSNIQITSSGSASYGNLVVSFGGPDSVTINSYFVNRTYAGRIENFMFSDGTVWDFAAIAARLAIRGTEGAEILNGVDGVANRIYGLGGNDSIVGAQLDDELYGGEGSDSIQGGEGNDLLVGGLGNDNLNGGQGNDTYMFNLGDGHDTIQENANDGSDTLRLGEGIIASNVQISRNSSNHLVLSFGATDSVTINGYFGNNNNGGRIENIVFSDNTIWDFAAVTNQLTTRGTESGEDIYGIAGVANRIQGLGGNDTIVGQQLDDKLYGGAGNDTLMGYGGNDLLVGGLGNDTLRGHDGNDTYLFNLGDGNDIIEEGAEQGTDTLRLGEGITTSNIQITSSGSAYYGNLVVSFGGPDSVTINSYFVNRTYAGRIENFMFSDGTVWDFAAIAARLAIRGTEGAEILNGVDGVANRIYGLGGNDSIVGAQLDDELYGGEGSDSIQGGEGNDLLVGGLGNDNLNGGQGNDTYMFNLGDGHDTIQENANDGSDTLRLGEGIIASNVQISRNSSNHLVLSFGATDSVTINGYFGNNNNNGGRIENIVFSDNTIWDFAAVTNQLTTRGTESGEDIYGIAGVANRIQGLGGNDTIVGQQLDDKLYGGAGNDTLIGYGGNDLLVGGLGNDTLRGESGNDTYLFNLGDGNDIIEDHDSTPGNSDIAIWGPDISSDQLWFTQAGNNLEISVIGRDQKISILNWYINSNYRIEQFRTNDGLVLTDSRVQNLVQAMASFSPPSVGQTTLPTSYQATLSPIIAANWQ
ncbi:Ca2+-binding RTX toxin-like protein [Acidovorax delafieldii]|uniref:calcium-binding protein n=1 Tax=Acidovorax delafieldii TaxID=47920 RepID=UPI00285F8F08|nr:calcium-binding protein [Acidovorax delafieldii]MDR6155544.1 Ca2+-binding RTX toxin-like protein [Acidovorax delafieldii]